MEPRKNERSPKEGIRKAFLWPFRRADPKQNIIPLLRPFRRAEHHKSSYCKQSKGSNCWRWCQCLRRPGWKRCPRSHSWTRNCHPAGRMGRLFFEQNFWSEKIGEKWTISRWPGGMKFWQGKNMKGHQAKGPSNDVWNHQLRNSSPCGSSSVALRSSNNSVPSTSLDLSEIQLLSKSSTRCRARIALAATDQGMKFKGAESNPRAHCRKSLMRFVSWSFSRSCPKRTCTTILSMVCCNFEVIAK